MSPANSDEHLLEARRLSALQKLRILDTPPEEAFDRIVRLVSMLFGMPISLISFLDEKRQWCKARYGSDAPFFPREIAFCAHTIQGDRPLVVPDLSRDARFENNILVKGKPQIRFYAGAPLRSADGYNLGTLSVMDMVPHSDFDVRQQRILEDLATLVVERLEARATAEALRHELLLHRHTQEELVKTVRHREMLLRELHHRVRNNLQAIGSIIQAKASLAGPDSPIRPELDAIAERIAVFARMHQHLYTSEEMEHVDLGQQTRRLVKDIVDLHGIRITATIYIVGGPILVDQDTAMHIGLLVNELMVNALRHAYEPGEAGTVALRLEHSCRGALRLTVQDWGRIAQMERINQRGIGTLLVEAITQQLGAQWRTEKADGWRVQVDIPAAVFAVQADHDA